MNGLGGAGQRAAEATAQLNSISFPGFYLGPFFSVSGGATAPTQYGLGGYAPVVADFNRDGKMDIATFGPAGVVVVLGDGVGGFGSPIVSPISVSASSYFVQSAQAADLNGDGYPDLVVVAGQGDALFVLLNQRNGNFTLGPVLEARTATSGSLSIESFGVGPLTSTGRNDIVAVRTVGPTLYEEVFQNDGTGAFPAEKVQTYTLSIANNDLSFGPTAALADVNHDGKLDLLIEEVLANNYQIDVQLGNGDGTFQPLGSSPAVLFPVPPQNQTTTGFPPKWITGFSLASLRGDPSRLDILLSSPLGPYVALSNGDGTFQAPAAALPNDPVQATAPGFTYYPNIGAQAFDLNGDGKLDLVVSETGGLATYLGNGGGTFGSVEGTALLSSSQDNNEPSSTQIAFADFNGDGKPDLVFADATNAYVGVGFGNGDGTFATAPLLFSSSPQISPFLFRAQAAADINGDGISDVVGINTLDGSVVSALSAGKGSFHYVQALSGSAYDVGYITPKTGDFNGDGRQDFILYGRDKTLAVALSNSDGTLKPPVTLPLVARPCGPGDLAIGDVNGDNKLDIVIAYGGDGSCPAGQGNTGANSTPSGYFVALGNGDGSFQPPSFTPFASRLQFFAALAPFHGAGKPLDLVLVDGYLYSAGPDTVSLLTGKGDGTFGAPVTVSSGSSIAGLLTDDFNGDGKADLTLPAFPAQINLGQSGTLLLLAGNGDGTFQPTVTLTPGFQMGEAVYADVNGDGIQDLLVADSESGDLAGVHTGLAVLPGLGNQTFSSPIFYPSVSGPLLIGNFLGDNTPSLIAGFQGAWGSAFLMNQGGASLSLTSTTSDTIATGQAAPLSVVLTPTLPNRPTPTGTVTFYDAKVQIGSASLSSGAAGFSVSGLAAGTHSITASYSGDTNFNPRTSSVLSITVGAPPAPDYALTTSSASLSVAAGQSGSVTLSIGANAGVSASTNVTFACSGLPAAATCAFAPATVQVAAMQISSDTLTISTKASSSNAVAHLPGPRAGVAMAGFGLAGLLLVTLPLGKRKRGSCAFTLTALLVLGATAGLSGCGGTNPSATPSAPGTPAGTSMVTVTATAVSGSITITHSTQLSLTVQ